MDLTKRLLKELDLKNDGTMELSTFRALAAGLHR